MSEKVIAHFNTKDQNWDKEAMFLWKYSDHWMNYSVLDFD